KGHLAFNFDGKRLKGRYHLVRLRSDRDRGKRNNWLLIKSDDEHAREGDDDQFLADTDFSVASGRKMAQIAEGKGRAPKPFITAKKGKAAAVWTSNRGDGEDEAPE